MSKGEKSKPEEKLNFKYAQLYNLPLSSFIWFPLDICSGSVLPCCGNKLHRTKNHLCSVSVATLIFLQVAKKSKGL